VSGPGGLPGRPLADEDEEDEEASHHVEAANGSKQNLKRKSFYFTIRCHQYIKMMFLALNQVYY
jgi:hypothetical protein